MRPLAVTAAIFFAWPSPARADTCREEHDSCLEDCHVDFGMEKDRSGLVKCVKRCGDRLADCEDLHQEERRSQIRLHEEQNRKPTDVRPATEDKPIDVHPAPPEDFEDAGAKGKGRARSPKVEDDPPAAQEKAEPAPPREPPEEASSKKAEPPQRKQDTPRGQKQHSDDDWAK